MLASVDIGGMSRRRHFLPHSLDRCVILFGTGVSWDRYWASGCAVRNFKPAGVWATRLGTLI